MKYVLSALAALFISLGVAPIAQADVNDFVIHNFQADYVLDNSQTGGNLRVNETIDLTFSDMNHGIFRYVPKTYHGYSTDIQVMRVERDGLPEKYSKYTESGNTVLKIGNPDRTISGDHTYKISYTEKRVVNFVDQPEFYWDVNGDGWSQTFDKVSATLELVGGNVAAAQTHCYTGIRGSQASNCSVTKLSDNKLLFATTKPLAASEGLTIASTLPGVTFTQPTWKDKAVDYAKNSIGLVIGVIGFLIAFLIWTKKGRDYKGRGTIVPEYEAPNGLSPAEVGMLADYNVDTRDLSATVIDLAVRGYLRLHETEKKVLFMKNKSFDIELLKTDTAGLKNHEISMLEGLFPTLAVGEMISLSYIDRSKMSKSVLSAKREIKNAMKDAHGMFESKSDTIAAVFTGVGVVLLFISFFVFGLGWSFFVGCLFAGLSFLLFGFLMPRRSHAGVEVYEKILGLKMYMDVAEKDRLKMMQSVDRPYAPPEKTVQLFEKLLPFAVALGVEKSWAKQFDGVLTEQPDWIDSSSYHAFNSAYIASSISGVASSFATSFESSSGLSGSSGGGGSGGGGGGGGGGGW